MPPTIESAIGRAAKLAARGGERGAIAVDVVGVYVSDAMDRVAHAGKQVVNALAAHGAAPESLRAAVAAVREHAGIDTVAARRRIADAAIGRMQYPFE